MSKFYCPAPWHSGYFTFDYQSVCCAHPGGATESPLEYLASQEVFEIKQRIASGDLTPDCQRCKDAEDAGYYSVSRTHNEAAAALGLELHTDPRVPSVPREIEVRFSNLCNFKCRMCAPYWSSMIATENIENPQLMRWYANGAPPGKSECGPRFVEDIKKLLPNLNKIYITGGEPMIQKPVMEFIDYMIHSGYCDTVMLQFATNVSVVNPLILDRLRRFRRVHLTLSLDGVGSTAEYQRHGTDWAKIDSNIQALGELRLARMAEVNMGIHTALSAYTVLTVDQLMSYCLALIERYHMSSWNVAQVQLPMTPRVLTGAARQQAIGALSRSLEILESSPVRQMKPRIYNDLHEHFSNLHRELCGSPGSHDEWKQFCGLTRDLDAVRGEDFARTFGIPI